VCIPFPVWEGLAVQNRELVMVLPFHCSANLHSQSSFCTSFPTFTLFPLCTLYASLYNALRNSKAVIHVVSPLSCEPMAYAVKYSVPGVSQCTCVLLYNPVALCCCKHRDFILNSDSLTVIHENLLTKIVCFCNSYSPGLNYE
jgi:hypothetical protein